jgi:two-component system response regulator FixJ
MKMIGPSDLADAREIYVIDDSSEIRRSLHKLFGSIGIRAFSFRSADDFLDDFGTLRPAPILVDIRMPEIGGLELMSELKRRENSWPVIVMTGHGEVPVAVQAMRLGAVEFLEKPFEIEALENALDLAFGALDDAVALNRRRVLARARLDSLTNRERQIVLKLVEGVSNKVAARDLALSVRTVEMHRAHAMKKLGANNIVEMIAILADASAEGDGLRDQSSE